MIQDLEQGPLSPESRFLVYAVCRRVDFCHIRAMHCRAAKSVDTRPEQGVGRIGSSARNGSSMRLGYLRAILEAVFSGVSPARASCPPRSAHVSAGDFRARPADQDAMILWPRWQDIPPSEDLGAPARQRH
jgi:hypothetical protein